MPKFDDGVVGVIQANFEAGDQPTEVNFADWIEAIQQGIDLHDHTDVADGDGLATLGSTAGPLTLTMANNGCHILDTGGDHDLIITPGEDLAADRILTLITGDAPRTITLGGNPTLNDWFDQSVKQAASPTFADVFVPDGGTFGIAGNELMTVDAGGFFSFSGILGIGLQDGDWVGLGVADERIIFNAAGSVYIMGAKFGVGRDPVYFVDYYTDVANFMAQFHNDGNNDNRHGFIILCGADANPSATYYSFRDGDGTFTGEVAGDGAGGVTYATASDERNKDKEGPIPEQCAMEALVNVSPFKYKGNKNGAVGTKISIGFSAQDIHRYFPEIARHDEKTDQYSTDYGRLVAVLWRQNQVLLARLEAGGL